MKSLDFLNQLKIKRIISLVEPSKEISLSYLKKSDDCLKSSKILFDNKLYENSTSEAYYCMYNSLLALLFNVGIKSENHSASILLFEKLFNHQELTKIISEAKRERIDKQYYVELQQISKVSEKSCRETILNAENFSIKIKVLISDLNIEKTLFIRKRFEELL